jgi:hypothetical protein
MRGTARQGQRTDLELPEDFPEVQPGTETRELAAEKAGFGNTRTYQQAKKVTKEGAAVVAVRDFRAIARRCFDDCPVRTGPR